MQANLGHRFQLKNGGSIGLTLSGQFRHEETLQDDERNTYSNEFYNYKGNSYTLRSNLGGIANIGYKDERNKIVFRNVYNHVFSSESAEYFGPMNGFGRATDLTRNYSTIALENRILQNRLEGERILSKAGFKVDWSFDRVDIDRKQPDNRNSVGGARYQRPYAARL